jgi:tRNA(Glu) U13 pseudouridine synthase TruD
LTIYNYVFLESLYGYPKELIKCKGTIQDFIVVEHLAKEEGDMYLYLVRKPSGVDFFRFIEHISKKLGLVKYAGLKDAIATAYFYVSSNKEISSYEGIWLIGKTRGLSPYFNRGNSFRITVEMNHSTECREYLGEIKEKLCSYPPKYMANFYGYQRFGLNRPINHVLGKTMRDRNIVGSWLYIRSKYGKHLPATEQWILKKSKKYMSVIPSIPTSTKDLILDSYTSYIFNLVTTRLMKRMGGFLFSSETMRHEKIFYTDNIYCGKRERTAYFVKPEIIMEILTNILREEKVNPRMKIFKRRPILVPICNYSCIDKGKELRLSFTLPSGSYATVLLVIAGVFPI